MKLVGLTRLPKLFVRILLVISLALALGATLSVSVMRDARAQNIDTGPVVVVATEKLQGPYTQTVLWATPLRDGHIGLILNLPTNKTMSQLFPEFAPAAKVTEKVYLGGDASAKSLVAVVRADKAPHVGAVQLHSNVWLMWRAAEIDKLIEATPNAARYFVGVTMWQPGELAAEVRKGWFTVRAPDPALFSADTTGLWQSLSAPRVRYML